MSLHQVLHLFTMSSSDFGIGINEYTPITAFALTVADLKTYHTLQDLQSTKWQNHLYQINSL